MSPQSPFQALQLGPLKVWPPVVLAPMAGITNYPFRSLCRRFGAGLYVSEMITARPLVEGNRRTIKLTDFGPEEYPRSLQLYGVDPYHVGEATKRLVGEGKVDHIDLNFGCSVKKVTRRGGGSAIPLKPRLLARIVRAAVENAGRIPVTIKVRIGIDDHLITYLDAGHIAEEEGCAAIGLHARTAEQFYAGEARWKAIAELKRRVKRIPVLGNGDIWEASDALRMMRETACDGVIVGRGCLGRPWLFRELAAAFDEAPAPPLPNFGEIADIMLEHATALAEWMGELPAMRNFRKHSSWYTKGFRSSASLRTELMRVCSLAELETLLAQADRDEPFPESALRVPRGKSGRAGKVVLPAGYLENREDDTPPGAEAELDISGG